MHDSEKISPAFAMLPCKPSDAELAVQYREKLAKALEPVLAIMAEAHQNGLTIGFQLGSNQFGYQFINNIDVVKKL